MRRLMAAAVLAVLCATVAACSDSDDSPTASASNGSATASASAAATGAAGSGNSEQICADAQKAITDAFAKFAQEVSKLGDSANKSATAQTIKAMFSDWADSLRDLADRATDGQLKAALADAADQVAKVAGSITSAGLEQADKLLDSPDVQAAQSKYESLCG
jgi:hypothetical protein